MSKKIRVLIVDDSAVVRQAMKEILESDPEIEVMDSAGDPFIAAEKIRKEIPDVITLDVEMPRMDGIEVLEAIRNDEKLKHIPVVMLTSSREEPDLKKCYELGSNAYIVKPVDFKEFIEAVRHIGVFWAVLNELPH